MAEEMTVLPGMDEVGSLLWIADHHDSGRYDVVVVDAAPTGETLRLLSLPEAGRWWMQKVEPLGRRITKLTGPIVKRVVGMPIPGDEVFDAGEALFARLEYMHGLLDRPGSKTSIRVVLTLEQVVIKEAQRSFTYFHLYGYPTDLVVANRVLPDEVGEYFRGWYEAQQRYGPLVDNAFHPIPVRKAPFFDREMVGHRPAAASWRAALYGDDDPTSSSTAAARTQVTRDNGELRAVGRPPVHREGADPPLAPCRRADHRPRHRGGARSSCLASSSTRRPRARSSRTAP